MQRGQCNEACGKITVLLLAELMTLAFALWCCIDGCRVHSANSKSRAHRSFLFPMMDAPRAYGVTNGDLRRPANIPQKVACRNTLTLSSAFSCFGFIFLMAYDSAESGTEKLHFSAKACGVYKRNPPSCLVGHQRELQISCLSSCSSWRHAPPLAWLEAHPGDMTCQAAR